MKKRVIASVLWFYAGWYAGAMIAELFGFSAALGPILGAAAGLIVGVDPRRIIWTKRDREPASAPTGVSEAIQTPA